MPDLSEKEKADYLVFVLERQATFQRWRKGAMWVVYALAAVGFVATLMVLSQVAPQFSFGFVAAVGGALVMMGFAFFVVLPRMPAPFLRCPYCSGRVPLIAPTKFAAPLEPYKVCPNCERSLEGA